MSLLLQKVQNRCCSGNIDEHDPNLSVTKFYVMTWPSSRMQGIWKKRGLGERDMRKMCHPPRISTWLSHSTSPLPIHLPQPSLSPFPHIFSFIPYPIYYLPRMLSVVKKGLVEDIQKIFAVAVCCVERVQERKIDKLGIVRPDEDKNGVENKNIRHEGLISLARGWKVIFGCWPSIKVSDDLRDSRSDIPY